MSKVSVLVVDDAPFIRDLVKKCLRNYFPGIVIEDAVNGRKAQALLERERFDLVLCDWEMPEMSGLELLTWCRQQEALKAMPFIMVTSRGDKENVVQAIQAGVSDFVGKPFTNEQLLTKVKKALTKAGKLDTLLASAPTRATSAFANDSLSALTGGKAETVRPAAAAAAPAAAASSGIISGTGLAIASTMGFGFIVLIISAVSTPGAETPMKISAPLTAFSSPPATFSRFEILAISSFEALSFSLPS